MGQLMCREWTALLVGALLLVSVAPGTEATHEGGSPHQIRKDAPQVWVKGSFAGTLHEKEVLENGTSKVPPGESYVWRVNVVNNRTNPIFNVTLAAIPQWTWVNLTLHETMAGDPPQKIYAYWDVIEGNGQSFTTMEMVIPKDASGPYRVVYLVTFENATGTNFYSATKIAGKIVPGLEEATFLPEEQPPVAGTQLVPSKADQGRLIPFSNIAWLVASLAAVQIGKWKLPKKYGCLVLENETGETD